jgi:tetratricopeptide (TPR) repeat protein
LERAYQSLAPGRRDLLSKIACFRGSMEYAVLKKVFPGPDLDKALLDLCKRGLLQYVGESQRYDMHPIVRHYAYDKFAAPDKTDAHTRLVNYFEAIPTPQTVTTLEDLAPVIELYHHMVRAGNLDEARRLFRDRLQKAIYYQFGAYQLQIELLRALFLDGEDKPPRLTDESAQAWTLNELANSYSLSGQPRRAVPLFEMTNDIYENKTKNKKHLAIGLGNVADDQLKIGALSAAERNLRRYIDLSVELGIEEENADAWSEIGRLLLYRGLWKEAEDEFQTSQKMFEQEHNVQGQSVLWSYRALRFLLMTWEAVGSNQLSVDSNQSQIENLKSAIECAQRALELADEFSTQTLNLNVITSVFTGYLAQPIAPITN